MGGFGRSDGSRTMKAASSRSDWRDGDGCAGLGMGTGWHTMFGLIRACSSEEKRRASLHAVWTPPSLLAVPGADIPCAALVPSSDPCVAYHVQCGAQFVVFGFPQNASSDAAWGQCRLVKRELLAWLGLTK